MLILIVEDEALINLTATDDLRSAGYEVESAYNADEALNILEQRSDVRALITDIEMPGSMDGLQLAAVVHDPWPPVHILIASGKAAPKSSELPPHSQFISKPWLIRDVLQVVRNFD